MNTPFFSTLERVSKLEICAFAWRGTPWRLNSMAIGHGVSCHNLPRAIYSESGFSDFPEIIGTPSNATALNVMEGFLDARYELERLRTVDRGLWTILQPGDLVGLFVPIDNVGKRIRGRVVNHLGVMLKDSRFVHTLLKRNTCIDVISSPPWSQILLAAWRPIEKGAISA